LGRRGVSDAASSPPAADATRPGTTGAALTPQGDWPEGGLAAPKISGGAVGHADPDAGLAPGEQQFVNDLVAVGMTR
jgi:hypothetical protein